MTPDELIEQLLALPDVEAQKQFLDEHVSLLDDEVASALKAKVDHFVRADNQRALQTVKLLYHMADLTSKSTHRALGLRAEGNICLIGLAEFQKAINLYDEAARIYEELGHVVDQAKAQVGKLDALSFLGRHAEALQVGAWIGEVLEAHGEWQTLAGLSISLGNVRGRAGDDAGSLEMFDQAAALCRQLEAKGASPALRLWVQTSRAIALCTLGRFKESIQASREAWEGLEQLGQKVESARARLMLAYTLFLVGRYNEALEHFDQVQDVFLADRRQFEAMLVELDTSYCLLQLRRFDEVLEKCSRVRSLFAELGTHHLIAQAIVNEAVAYAALDHCPQALASLTEAQRIFQKEGNITWTAMVDLERAAVLMQQAHHDEALVAAQECAEVFLALGRPVEEAQAHLLTARAALALERYDEAQHLAKTALDAGEAMKVGALIYQGHQLLGAVAAARSEPETALLDYQQAIEMVEQLRGRLMVEFRVSFLEDKEKIYQEVVGLCLDLGQPSRGLEFVERAKSRALLDLLAYRLNLGIQARDPEDEPIVDELLNLRARRDRLYRRWETDTTPGERGWTSEQEEHQHIQQGILALEKQITDLWHRLLIRNADYAREASLWNIRIEPVQPYLDPNALLIEYYITGDKLLVFLVSAEAVEARRLDCDLTQVQKLIQLLWLNLKAVPKSDSERLAALETNAQGILKRLYNLLLASIATEAQPFKRLIIVPHGPLHYLPFHALHDGTSFLLERHEISYLPAASFLRYCEEARRANAGMMAMGYSLGGQLPHTAQEARSVADLFGGRVLLEEQATLAELREAAPQLQTLHLAAHGDFRPDNPLFSGLALADGWLTTLDVFDLQLDASLVTLSACQTGRNLVGSGDELLGLMRAFLSTGAASLVLTLWAVEDRSTARLMETFYRKLADGWTKGQALRHAQLQFLHGQQETEDATCSHPYFWAPFFLVGHAGPL